MNLTDPYAYDLSLYHGTSAVAQSIGLVINVTTIWLIVSHSPGEMSTYKWHLLYFTILGAYMDIHLDLFMSGIIFLPLPCGTLSGLARTLFGMSTFVGLVSSILVIAEMSVCTCHLFIYRLQIVLPHSSRLKIRDDHLIPAIVIYHVLWDLMILVLCYFALYVEDQPTARELFVLTNPDIRDQSQVEGFFVTSVTSKMESMVAMALLLLTIVVCGALNGFCSFYSFKLLEKMATNMSERTREMHKSYMKALVAQILFPTLVIALPGMWIMICILLQKDFCRNQNLSNLLMVSIGWHGACSSLLIIFSNSSYRTRLSRILAFHSAPKQPGDNRS